VPNVRIQFSTRNISTSLVAFARSVRRCFVFIALTITIANPNDLSILRQIDRKGIMANNRITSRKNASGQIKRKRKSQARQRKSRLDVKKFIGDLQNTIRENAKNMDNLSSNEGRSENRKDGEHRLGNEVSATGQIEFIPSIQEFQNKVRIMLLGQALHKGYRLRDLDDFMNLYFRDHALGEIVYKAIRYQRLKNQEDLVKIAAWAFLLYDRMIRNNENKSESTPKDSNEK
jgi:hypothetical protein